MLLVLLRWCLLVLRRLLLVSIMGKPSQSRGLRCSRIRINSSSDDELLAVLSKSVVVVVLLLLFSTAATATSKLLAPPPAFQLRRLELRVEEGFAKIPMLLVWLVSCIDNIVAILSCVQVLYDDTKLLQYLIH